MRGTAVHAMSRVPCHCPGCQEHRRRRAYRVTGNPRDGEPGNVWRIVYAANEEPRYENDFGQRHDFVAVPELATGETPPPPQPTKQQAPAASLNLFANANAADTVASGTGGGGSNSETFNRTKVELKCGEVSCCGIFFRRTVAQRTRRHGESVALAAIGGQRGDVSAGRARMRGATMRANEKWQPYAAQLGQRIKKLRTAAGLSLTRCADAAGISKSYLHELENGAGGATPSVFVALDLATALGVSVEALVGVDGAGNAHALANVAALELVSLRRRMARIGRLATREENSDGD